MKNRTFFYNYFLSLVVLTSLSWGRFLMSNGQFALVHKASPIVSIVLWTIFALSISWSIYGFVKIEEEPPTFVQKLILLGVSFFQLPFISNDLYSYFYYGQLTLDGLSPYYKENLQSNYFLSFCDPIYKETICMYGPLGLFFLKFIAFLSFKNIWLALLSYKIISLSCILTTILYLERASKSAIFLFVPIVITQLFGQGHLELFGVLLLIVALDQYQKNNYFYYTLLLFLATLIKFNFILFFFMILLIPNFFKSLKSIKSVLFASLFGLFITVLFYYPLIYAPTDLLIPLKNMSQLRPSGGWQDIGTFLYCLTHHVDGTIASNSIAVYNILKPLFTIIALLFTGFGFYKQRKQASIWMFLLLFLVIVMISNRVFSWYFLLFIPLFVNNVFPPQSPNWILLLLSIYSLSESSLILNNSTLESIVVVLFMIMAIVYSFCTYKKLITCSEK